MNIRMIVFLLSLLVSNSSYGLDFSGIVNAGKGVLDASEGYVKEKMGLEETPEEEKHLRELLKPGVELQISKLTGLQPTHVEIDSISMIDPKGLINHAIQKGKEAGGFTPDDITPHTRKAEVDFEIDLKLDCLFVFALGETVTNRIRIKSCKMVFEPDWSDVSTVGGGSIEQLMKPGVESQVSQLTGLQPKSIEISDVSVTDAKGMAIYSVQELSKIKWFNTSPDDDSTYTQTAIVDFEIDLKLGCLSRFIQREQTPSRIKIADCKMIFESDWSDIPEVSGDHSPHQ